MTIPQSLAAGAAKEAVKPIVSLIQERVVAWRSSSKLKTLIAKQDKLDELLSSYIDRVIKRSSEISTIIFPQRKIRLDAIYEPVTLEVVSGISLGNARSVVINTEGDGRCYFIIDEAGMGKSTFSKNLAMEIIRETDKIPILFDLLNFEIKDSVFENIAKEFDERGMVFDRALLWGLIEAGKFFIILDGFDELPREASAKAAKEIVDFNNRKGKSNILITSRPQELLPLLSGCEMIRIKKLSERQAKAILYKLDGICESDGVGARLINEFEKIPQKFLETPLLISLLYKTYGYNGSIADSISVFYSEIYLALYKGHDLTKAGFVREKISNLDVAKFRRLLAAFAFLYTINQSDDKNSQESMVGYIQEALSLCDFESGIAESFFDDLLTAVPLLVRDGNNFKFMHKTIAEYFAAEFVSGDPDSERLLADLVKSDFSGSLRKVFEFVYEINGDLYRRAVILPIAERYLNECKKSDKASVLLTEKFLFDSYIMIVSKHCRATDMEGVSGYIRRDIGGQELGVFFKSKFFFGVPESKELMVSFRAKEEAQSIEALVKLIGRRFSKDKYYKLCTNANRKLFENPAFLNFLSKFALIRVGPERSPPQGLVICPVRCRELILKIKRQDQHKKALLEIIRK